MFDSDICGLCLAGDEYNYVLMYFLKHNREVLINHILQQVIRMSLGGHWEIA